MTFSNSLRYRGLIFLSLSWSTTSLIFISFWRRSCLRRIAFRIWKIFSSRSRYISPSRGKVVYWRSEFLVVWICGSWGRKLYSLLARTCDPPPRWCSATVKIVRSRSSFWGIFRFLYSLSLVEKIFSRAAFCAGWTPYYPSMSIECVSRVRSPWLSTDCGERTVSTISSLFSFSRAYYLS